MAGIRTPDLTSSSSLTSVVGNKETSTGVFNTVKTPVESLAAQIQAITGVLRSVVRVKSRTISTPPATPAVNDTYIVGASPTGDWVGHANDIAVWTGAWTFATPTSGSVAVIDDEHQFVYYDGAETRWLLFGGTAWRLNRSGGEPFKPQYNVDGSWRDIGSSVLSDGNTGTGSIVHANSPTLTGTPAIPGLPNLTTNVESTGVPGLDGAHWFIWNNVSGFDATATLRIDRHITEGTSVVGQYSSLLVNGTTPRTNVAGNEWTILGHQVNHTLADSPSQNVAVQGTNSKTILETSAVATLTTSGTGATATVTFAGSETVPVGESVRIQGVTPAGYNGVWKVTASAPGSVSFASTATGAQTVAGTLVRISVGRSWGGNFNCRDATKEIDPIAACVGAEINVYAQSGAGTDVNKQRVGLQISVGVEDAPDSNVHIGRALLINPANNAVIDNAIDLLDPTLTISRFLVEGNGGTTINSTKGSWGLFNYGRGLLVTNNGTHHPAIGISDVNGANWWAVINENGTLRISAMPATTDAVSPPVNVLSIDRSTAVMTMAAAPVIPLTGYLKGNGASALTAAATVPSADFADGNTGTGAVAHANSPSFTTPFIGAATATSISVGGNQVVGARVAGWGAPTGTLDRTALAAYAGQTVSAAYVQAEAQATDNAVKKVSQELAALITDLRAHGLIGT